LDLLMVNHRDPLHPKAGGAEQVLYEVGKRIARMGRVTWLAESVKGRKEREVLEGIQILRRGNGFTLHLHSIMEARRHDVTIDSVAHAVPFFSHLVNERTLALVHHVHQEVLRYQLPPVQAAVLRWLERRIKGYPRLIAVSQTTKRELIKLGVESDRVRVIYNGVDHQKYRPGEKARRPTLLWIGRMVKYKNPLDALRIYGKLRNGAEMIVAGGGEMEDQVREVAERVGAKFLGKVSEEEKVRLYQRAWVILSTSFVEGWGMTLVEANACGTPAVGYAVGSVPEVIQEGVNGFLVKYGDVEAAAREVDRILGMGKEEREDLWESSYRSSLRYDWEVTAQEYLEELSRVFPISTQV